MNVGLDLSLDLGLALGLGLDFDVGCIGFVVFFCE